MGYCAPEEVYMKVYNHVRKISLQPVNTGHRASHILIRFIDGRCERISDDMRDRLGEPLLREGRSVRSGFFIIRKSKCSTDFKRNDFLKKNEAYPLGALRSLKFAYRKLRISLFVELAV